MFLKDSLIDDGAAGAASNTAVGGASALAVASVGRSARFMVEGVGARVIRGPDWKWGKQVLGLSLNSQLYFLISMAFL